MATEKTVSVIIAAYNAEQYISTCLESLINQTCLPYEVLVVNDGSTDATAAILDEYANRFTMIRVIHQSNHGTASSRNRALSMAQGDYFTYLDSDDTLDHDFIETYLAAIGKDAPDVVCGGYKRVDAEGGVLRVMAPRPETEWAPYLISAGCAKLYRTEFIAANSIEFSNRAVGEDLLFVFEVVSAAKSVKSIAYCGYNYLDNATSASNSFAQTYDKEALLDLLASLTASAQLADETNNELRLHFIIRVAVWYLAFLQCPYSRQNVTEIYGWLDDNLSSWRTDKLATPFRPKGDELVNRVAVWLFVRHKGIFWLVMKNRMRQYSVANAIE